MTAPRKWDLRMCELHDRLTAPNRTLTASDLRELSDGIDGLLVLQASVRMQARHAYEHGSALSGSTTLAAQLLRTLEGET